MPNAGGQFKFQIKQRVIYLPPFGGPLRTRILDRTTEAALGKTYKIRVGRGYFFVPEESLSEIPKRTY